jgi:hypothetical protein
MDFTGFKSTHSGRLERWIGAEKIAEVSGNMRGWYGPPIAIQGVPGRVFATKDGDFIGDIRDGFECSALDRADAIRRRLARAMRIVSKRERSRLNAGFTSLSDLISEATAGNKQQAFSYQKNGTTGVISATNSLFHVGTQPAAGVSAAAAPGGVAPTRATQGALIGWVNPAGGDTTHLVSANHISTVAGNSLLLYDRIFSVNKTMNSTAAEAVTGVPTRYQNTTAGAADYIGGNFLFIECTTVLPGTAHNWTPCTYLDQANAASTLPLVTGNSANIVNRLDMPLGFWFCPLETGDVGVKALTNMQASAAVATGVINFTIGHPLAWAVCPVANMVTTMDYLNTAFNLVRVFDDACLAFLEPIKSAVTATAYTGTINIVSG